MIRDNYGHKCCETSPVPVFSFCSRMRLIEFHCYRTYLQFSISREEVMKKAKTLNVIYMLYSYPHIQIPLTGYVGLLYIITQYRCGYCKLEWLWRYAEGTLQLLYNLCGTSCLATPSCSNHKGTVLYDTYLASRRNLDVYLTLSYLWNWIKIYFKVHS